MSSQGATNIDYRHAPEVPGKQSRDKHAIAGATPLYMMRIITTFVTGWMAVASVVLGFIATQKALQQRNAIISHFLITYSIRVTVANGSIYTPSLLANIGCIGLLVSCIVVLWVNIRNHYSTETVSLQKLKGSLWMQIVAILIFSIWLLVTLIFGTIAFSTRTIRVTRTDGQSIPPWDVLNALMELGIADRFRRISYWRVALAIEWATVFAGLVAVIFLGLARIGLQGFSKEAPDMENSAPIILNNHSASADMLDTAALPEKRMSAREEPGSSPDMAERAQVGYVGSEYASPQYEEEQDIVLQDNTTPRSPQVAAAAPQLSALQADSDGEIVEVPLDSVSPPVRVHSLDDGTHSFVQNDDSHLQRSWPAV